MATSASLQTVEKAWLSTGKNLDVENYVIHCNSTKLWKGFCGHVALHEQSISSSRMKRLGVNRRRKQLPTLSVNSFAGRKSGKNYSITLLPGDGTVPAIVEVAVNVLKLVGKQEGIRFKFQEAAIGRAAIDAHGVPVPGNTLDACRASDAVLSSTTHSYVTDGEGDCGLSGLRADLRTTAELCPLPIFSKLTKASRREGIESLEIMIVREPSEGMHRRKREDARSDGQSSGMVLSAAEVDQIVRMGFETAQKRRKRLCSVDKSNAAEVSRLWRERVRALHEEYPDVELSHMTVDGAALQLIRNPSQFDTIVTANVFGDILSDEASLQATYLGGRPSATISATGPGLFEAVYASSMDAATQEQACPLLLLLSAAMMLRYGLGELSAASRLEAAIRATLDAGFRTEHSMLPGQTLVGCRRMGEIVMEKLMTTAPKNSSLISGVDRFDVSLAGRTLELSGRSSGPSFRVNRRGMPVMAMTKDATKDAEDEKRQLPPTESEVLAESDSEESSQFSFASAVKEPSIQGVGTAAMVTGAVAVALLVSVTLLEQVDSLPLLPQAMQFLGVAYCAFAARRFLARGSTSLTPDSPVKYVMDFLPEKGSDGFAVVGKGAEALKVLAEERDAAVQEMESLRRTTGEIARVVAEKEALEAVAMQLADERDVALTEVSALKKAVDAMTERMKAIEAMLEQEVQQLKLQNQALETVALQLASERDAALNKVDELQKTVALGNQSVEEKATLEVVAMHLAQERDQALAEIDNLKQVVADLRASASGLTPQQETFIKSRAREIRSQFIDIDKSYEEQEAAANQFVAHLVEEYGAPKEWTADYMKQFLNSSWTRTAGASNNHKSTSMSGEAFTSSDSFLTSEPFFK